MHVRSKAFRAKKKPATKKSTCNAFLRTSLEWVDTSVMYRFMNASSISRIRHLCQLKNAPKYEGSQKARNGEPFGRM